MLAENIALGAVLGIWLILLDLLYIWAMKRALCAVEKTEEVRAHIHRWSKLVFVNVPFWCIVWLPALVWRESGLLPLTAVVATVIFSAVLANRELKSRRMLLRDGKRIYRTVEWTPVIHGETHKISYRFERDKEEHKLFVDGHEHPLQNKAAKALFRMDECVVVDGQSLHLVRAGNKVDLAVDGVFLERQKPYLPGTRFAWWFWGFVVVCLAIVCLGFTVVPLDAIFFRADSPEKVFHRLSSDPVVEMVYGNDSCMIVSVDGAGVYQSTYLAHDEKGYRIPRANTSKRVYSTAPGAVAFDVVRLSGTADHFLVGTATGMTDAIEISDSLCSDFYIIKEDNTESSLTTYRYYAYLDSFDDDYCITIDGQTLRAGDMG